LNCLITEWLWLAGVYGSGYLHKLRHCIIEEALVAFAKITFLCEILFVKTGSVFHTTAATDGKISADEAFVAKILLGLGKSAFFTAVGELFYRRFKYIAQSPPWLDEKITAKTIACVLDNDITAALFIEGANRMLVGDAIR